jgi:hypothetical protein
MLGVLLEGGRQINLMIGRKNFGKKKKDTLKEK